MFTVRGLYRVQSRRDSRESELRGHWISEGRISSAHVNSWLAAHPLWHGQEVNVRSAAVTFRSGAFTDADALYYREHLTAAEPAYDLPCNVIDVTKLLEHWTRRAPLLRAVFDAASWALIESRVDAVIRIASDEYHVHEAGHALGWSVQEKASAGHFQLGGATIWPLVFVEEVRADLGSLGAALDLLGSEAAVGVFLYHLAHRFGLAAETTGELSVGVPYLLFGVCLEHGAIDVDAAGSIRVVVPAIQNSMRSCADLAAQALTTREVIRGDAADAAVNAAAFFRRYALDERLLRAYRGVFDREALSRRMGRMARTAGVGPTSSAAH